MMMERVPFGYTPSDGRALQYWWIDSGRSLKKQQLNDVSSESIGKNKNNIIGLKVDEVEFPEFNIDMGNETDFNKVWNDKKEAIAEVFIGSLGPMKGVINLSNFDNIVDFSNWNGSHLGGNTYTGNIIISGLDGDDMFLLKGPKYAKNNKYSVDLIISGGKGYDTVVLPDAFDFPMAKAGRLAGKKVIRFYGESQDVVSSNGRIIQEDREQGVLLRPDIEEIIINDVSYTFSELFDAVKSYY